MTSSDWRLPRNNPFRVERQHQLRFRGACVSIAELLTRFNELGRRAHIVGPHGTGKTTLLEELITEFQSQGQSVTLLRLSASAPRESVTQFRHWMQQAAPQQILVLDGAEQLGAFRWWWLLRASQKYAGLLVTTHTPGWLPILYQTGADRELLQQLVAELAPELNLPPQEFAALFARHAGNVRCCLRELYDRVANGELTAGT